MGQLFRCPIAGALPPTSGLTVDPIGGGMGAYAGLPGPPYPGQVSGATGTYSCLPGPPYPEQMGGAMGTYTGSTPIPLTDGRSRRGRREGGSDTAVIWAVSEPPAPPLDRPVGSP